MHTCRASKRERRPVQRGDGDEVDVGEVGDGVGVGDDVDDVGSGDAQAITCRASKRERRPVHRGDGDDGDVGYVGDGDDDRGGDVDVDAQAICIRAVLQRESAVLFNVVMVMMWWMWLMLMVMQK